MRGIPSHNAQSFGRAGRAVLSVGLIASVLAVVGGQTSPAGAARIAGDTKPAAVPPSTRPGSKSSYDKITVTKPGPTVSVVLSSPSGVLRSADDASEIRWLFDRPVVDLSAVGERSDPSSYVRIEPAVAGEFRWPSTRMLVFTPTTTPPGSTAFTATLSGIKALDGTTLAAPSVLRFETPRVRCSLHDAQLPSFRVTCDQPVDGVDVAAHTQAVFRAVKVKSSRYQPSPDDLNAMRAADAAGASKLEAALAGFPGRAGEVASLASSLVRTAPCDKTAKSPICYTMTAAGDVPQDAVATLRFSAGIASTLGPLPGRAGVSGRIPTPRTPLVVTTNCTVNCNPESFPSVSVVGSEFAPADLDGKLKVTDVKTGTTDTYTIPPGSDLNDLPALLSSPFDLRWAGLQPLHSYRIEIDQSAKNAVGIALGYRSITTMSLGRFDAYAYMRGGERVVEASTAGLEMQVRNVSAYERVARPLAAEEVASTVRSYAAYPKTRKINLNAEKSKIVALKQTVDAVHRLRVNIGDTPAKAGDKPKSGVYLLAIRAQTYVPASRYTSGGRPWVATDDAAENARRARKTYATGADGDGWSSTLVQRTDLAVTLKRSPANVLIAVTSLATGAPVKGARVSLFGLAPKAYWNGKTDADGFVFGSPDTAPGCGSCDIVAVVQKDDDLAYAQSVWREWGDQSPYIDQTPGNGTTGPSAKKTVNPSKLIDLAPGERLTGALFADRGVYKLGEQVHVKGVVRKETPKHLEYVKDLKEAVIEVRDPRDAGIAVRTVKVSDTGAFDAVFSVPTEGMQGSYSVTASGDRGTFTSTNFLVTTYRKPDFVVDVASTKRAYIAGDTAVVNVDGRYLYGAPMAGAGATGTFRGTSSDFDPSADHPELKLDGYRWSYVCYDDKVDPCGSDASSAELGTFDNTLDGAGRYVARQDTSVSGERHRPLSVDFEANVTDVSRQAFAARTSFLVHPGEFYLGARQSGGYTSAGKPLPVEVIALTPDGKVVPGVKVSATLIRWDWVSVKQDNGDGTFSTDGRYRKTVVTTLDATTAAKPAPVTFTPDKAGEYEVRFEAQDKRGNAIEAGISSYVLGRDYVSWRTSDQPVVELLSDKVAYATGDTAQILVKSPWPKAAGMLTIERNGVLSVKRFAVDSSASTISVAIDADLAPNAYASVTLFKGRTAKPSADHPDDPGRPQVLSGTVELKVPLVQKTLAVKVSTEKQDYLPGAKTDAVVQVRGADGKATKGEVTLWAVDEGVLRLTNYTTPDLVSVLYPERSLEVDTSDSRMKVVSLSLSEDKGAPDPGQTEPGGGGGEDPTGEGIRTDFRVLAAWSATVKVGDDGMARVPMKLPESLTAYRVIAVAASGADRFGGATSEVRVRKPFSLLPALPRFVNLGDTFEAGAVVHNQTGANGDANVSLVLAKDSPVVVDGPSTITLPGLSDKPTEVRFKLKATKVGPLRLTLKGSIGAGGTPETTDAVAGGFPVSITRRLEAVATSGTVKAGAAPAVEQLSVPGKVYADLGGLDVTAASSALAGLQNGIASLVEYPYGCLEQRSSRIRVLLELASLDSTYKLPGIAGADLRAVVQRELTNLRDFQTTGGGLSYWPGDTRPDLYLSPRVLMLLQDARAAGYKLPSGMVPSLLQFLQAQVTSLTTPSTGDGGDDQALPDDYGLEPNRAQIAWALARSGRSERALTNYLYEQRFDLTFLEQLHLLRAMLENGRVGDEPNALYADLKASLRIENDQAFVQNSYDWSAFPGLSYLDASNVSNTAELLSLMTRIEPKSDLVPKMAKWLLVQRTNATWSNTLDDGYALRALMDVARATEATAPDLQAQILVGTTKVLDEKFTGRDLTIRSSSTPIPKLGAITGGVKTPLMISASGTGTLQWSARLRYAPDLDGLTALDSGFTVERTYFRYTPAGEPLPKQGSTTFAAGDLVRVQLKFSTAQSRTNAVIDDPLPAGLEALNAALASTSTEANAGASDTGTSLSWYEGIDRTEIRDDRVLLFATTLDPGEHVFTYVARATAPGTFIVPPAQAEEMYRPEVFGRTATVRLTVTSPGAK